MEIKPPYLCLSARYGELRWCLSDEGGRVLHQGTSGNTIREFLSGWEPHFATLGIAVSPDREKELKTLPAQDCLVRTCSWNDATLAGALSGRPGVWLSMDHWIPLVGSCHSSDAECPDHGGQSMGLAREANHRTVALVQAEASLDWLSRQALTLATPEGGLHGTSLQRVARFLQPFHTEPTSPQRARAVRNKVLELADFPGPEPASLALLAKTARRLSDLMRHLCGRVRLSESRAIWADGPLEGPLWNALAVEFGRYLPGLTWSEPDYPSEVGVLLLLEGERLEQVRQSLNPNRTEEPQLPAVAEFSQNGWRQLARAR